MIITVLKDIPDVYFGGFSPEIHNPDTCQDCKNNCCQYQVEMPWIKLGLDTMKAGEQYEIGDRLNMDTVRLLLLPEKMITADVDIERLSLNTDLTTLL